MHELSLMESTLQIASDHAREAGATRIHRILLQVGETSGVDPSALEFAFEALAPGSIAEDAALEIHTIPTLYWCTSCAREFRPGGSGALCPQCGGWDCELRAGGELELRTMEVS